MPLNNKTIVNSDQILQMANLPRTLIVVGGGVIGVEYTCMFSALGVRVILIEKRPRLLEFADQEIIEALCYHLRDNRVTLRLNEEVDSVEETADGTVVANLKSKKKISGDTLLYAIGRQGNVVAAVSSHPQPNLLPLRPVKLHVNRHRPRAEETHRVHEGHDGRALARG